MKNVADKNEVIEYLELYSEHLKKYLEQTSLLSEARSNTLVEEIKNNIIASLTPNDDGLYDLSGAIRDFISSVESKSKEETQNLL